MPVLGLAIIVAVLGTWLGIAIGVELEAEVVVAVVVVALIVENMDIWLENARMKAVTVAALEDLAAAVAVAQTPASIVGNRGILPGSVLMHLDKEGEKE